MYRRYYCEFYNIVLLYALHAVCSLLDPGGTLSSSILSQVIAQANLEVQLQKTKPCLSAYTKYSATFHQLSSSATLRPLFSSIILNSSYSSPLFVHATALSLALKDS